MIEYIYNIYEDYPLNKFLKWEAAFMYYLKNGVFIILNSEPLGLCIPSTPQDGLIKKTL